MIHSLKAVFPDAVVYVLTFDADTYLTIKTVFNNQNVIPIKLESFEDEELFSIKSTRTNSEYYWTCTPKLVLYCLSNYQLPDCTYIDADLFFYDTPEHIFDAMGKASCLITPHYFSLPYFLLKRNGTYCVQFMPFRNNKEAIRILKHWSRQCIEWCFSYREKGKYGDQGYLNSWKKEFKDDVAVLHNKFAALGPWNILYYSSRRKKKTLEIASFPFTQWHTPVFYHFHRLKTIGKIQYAPSIFILTSTIQKMIYEPYIRLLQKTEKLYDIFGKTY